MFKSTKGNEIEEFILCNCESCHSPHCKMVGTERDTICGQYQEVRQERDNKIIIGKDLLKEIIGKTLADEINGGNPIPNDLGFSIFNSIMNKIEEYEEDE